jgi:hypothetical protein
MTTKVAPANPIKSSAMHFMNRPYLDGFIMYSDDSDAKLDEVQRSSVPLARSRVDFRFGGSNSAPLGVVQAVWDEFRLHPMGFCLDISFPDIFPHAFRHGILREIARGPCHKALLPVQVQRFCQIIE